MECSCKGCTERYIGCHDTCEKYKQYRMEWNKRKIEMRNKRRLDSLHRR